MTNCHCYLAWPAATEMCSHAVCDEIRRDPAMPGDVALRKLQAAVEKYALESSRECRCCHEGLCMLATTAEKELALWCLLCDTTHAV